MVFYIEGYEITDFIDTEDTPRATDWCALINSSDIPYTASYKAGDDYTVYIKADNPGSEYCLPFGLAYFVDDSWNPVRDEDDISYSGETLAIETESTKLIDKLASATLEDFLEDFSSYTLIVETWSSGTNWYRKYSDGWIEQGGYFNCSSSGTILTFHQSFSDTNYYLNGNGSQITAGLRYVSFYNRTSTTAACYTGDDSSFNSAYVYWYACGY